MNVLQLKEKVSKGIDLGAEIVYIKEENILFGLQSAIHDGEKVIFIKSDEESIKSNDFMNMIEDICKQRGSIEVYIGEDSANRNSDKPINTVEFAQYENMKMLFLNSEI